MRIYKALIKGFRNFHDAEIVLAEKTLIIGSNDVGKTNLITAIRKLLDRSLSELDLEPVESDFHIRTDGSIADSYEIRLHFSDITEDSVIATFPGKITADGNMILMFQAQRSDFSFSIFAGRNEANLEQLPSRYYLKHLCMKVVDSRRDLNKFIQSEKKYLLKVAQELRSVAEVTADGIVLAALSEKLAEVNSLVGNLHYVAQATNEVNSELKSLAHHNSTYAVHLNSVALDVTQFVEKLELAGSTNGATVGLGGDGRNNQILLALWKAKAAREFDHDNEVVIYCVEEPEAHLHPHQQRKLASYLTSTLKGQTIVTTHSPQIVSGYKPDSIVRLKRSSSSTKAASNGCSSCISGSWDEMGYRMSILPAEAFFASVVLLVEGPSELLFYHELAKQLNLDLDFYNVSLLSVDGIAFEVYASILRAMEIPFAVRTDNDISDIATGGAKAPVTKRNLAGLNRCLKLAKYPALPHKMPPYSHRECLSDGTRDSVVKSIEPFSIFVSRIDLETDMGEELQSEFVKFKGSVTSAVAYLGGSKAIRMREFLTQQKAGLKNIKDGELAKPLLRSIELAKAEVLL